MPLNPDFSEPELKPLATLAWLIADKLTPALTDLSLFFPEGTNGKVLMPSIFVTLVLEDLSGTSTRVLKAGTLFGTTFPASAWAQASSLEP